jgi:hypothetical protein
MWPEWVYWVGWLAVPVALVALSGWWHERDSHRELDAYLVELQNEHRQQATMNRQLRAELSRVDREIANLRYVAKGGDTVLANHWPETAADIEVATW